MTKSIPAGAFLGGLPVYLLGNLCPISERNKQVVSRGGFNSCCVFAQYSFEGPIPSEPGYMVRGLATLKAYNQFTPREVSTTVPTRPSSSKRCRAHLHDKRVLYKLVYCSKHKSYYDN